jgi:3',5'-cyclic AMP phosphodiesterase CpdA
MKYKISVLLILLATLIINLTINANIASSGNIKKINFNGFNESANTLKFVHLSDVHLDLNNSNKPKRMLGSSRDLLKDAISQINNINDLDFVIFSGDQINRPQKNALLEFINISNTLKYPWYFALGNHDVGVMSSFNKFKYFETMKESNKAITTDKTYYSFSPKKGYLIIVLDPVIDSRITSNGYVDAKQFKWLESQLDNNKDSRIIIVQHHPIIQPFDSSSHKITNSEEYLSLIKRYNNVIAVLSGHYHSTKIIQLGNVVFVSTPALVQYPNAFRLITINDYKDKTTLKFEFMETGLKSIQQAGKASSTSLTLEEGTEPDRNAVITIKK